MNDLDPEKNIFLQSDIDLLQKKYETKIDDEIKGAPVEFFLAAGKIFNTRMEEASCDMQRNPFKSHLIST